MSRLERHKQGCHTCDTDSLCPAATEIRQQEVTAALKREYEWLHRRYSENVNGIRKHGGNCFNEQRARKTLDSLEIEADELGIDHRAIKRAI